MRQRHVRPSFPPGTSYSSHLQCRRVCQQVSDKSSVAESELRRLISLNAGQNLNEIKINKTNIFRDKYRKM